MRKDDASTKQHFRSDRFFVVSGQYYFTTREGEDFGPFENRDEAANKLSDYLETQTVMKRLRDIDPTLDDSDDCNVKKIAELSSDIQKERQRDG
jgi:hypothetical protein